MDGRLGVIGDVVLGLVQQLSNGPVILGRVTQFGVKSLIPEIDETRQIGNRFQDWDRELFTKKFFESILDYFI